jgi:threonine/homoserine/homoserine lactone efflux protein
MTASRRLPPTAGSTSAAKPVTIPARRMRRTRSAAALALRPTAAPRSRQESRPSSRSSLRISLSTGSNAAIVADFGLFCLRLRRRGGTKTIVDPSAALVAGLAAGLAIAMQVGVVSLLLVETAVVGGPRVGVPAAMGVATADLAFAVIAAGAGGAAGAALASHEGEIRLIAAVVVGAIAIHGLIAVARAGAATNGASAAPNPLPASRPAPARVHFARFLAITAANPLTIASFAAVAAALSLDGPAAAAAFAAGVGLASALWHALLSLAAGHAGRWMTPRVRRGFAIGGRVAVLALAAHLALGA